MVVTDLDVTDVEMSGLNDAARKYQEQHVLMK